MIRHASFFVQSAAAWRTLAPFAALFLLLILFAVGGMFVVAYEADRSDAARAREAVSQTFSGIVLRLDSAAEMNAATLPIAGALSGPSATPASTYGYFNFTNKDAFGYHGTVVLNHDGSAFAGTRFGLPWKGAPLVDVARVIAPVAARLPARGAGTVNAVIRDGHGQALAVAVANMVPDAKVAASAVPRRLAMIAPVVEQLLPKMLPSLGVEDFRIVAGRRNLNTVAIATEHGSPIVLAWRPRTPGRAAVVRWAPVIGGLLLTALVMLAIAARKNFDTTQALKYLAHHDGLTGLANRSAFRTELARRLSRRETVTVGVIDLNDFKSVNDMYGHPVGDALLHAVAIELSLSATSGDMVARLGGDEFAWISQSSGAAKRLAEGFADRIERPLHVGRMQLRIGASIGVALAQPGMTEGALLALADARLYAIKHRLQRPRRRRAAAVLNGSRKARRNRLEAQAVLP